MRGWNSQAYGELAPSPSLRATQKGTSLSWLTVIAPRAADVPASDVSATASVSQSAATVALTSPTGSATVNLDDAGGSRTAFGPVTPVAVPTADIVLAGSSTVIRGTGLPPGDSARLEVLPEGALAWSPAGDATAGAAGTVEIPVTATSTADYRVVSGLTASAPVHVTAAVAPQPVGGLTATPSGRGQVTVAWTPPADTGGAPLTRYVVKVAGREQVLPPTATSVEFSGVVAGTRDVTVRAVNAVARSPWSTTSVAVPAYPTIAGPHKARKGSRVTLTMTGLLPGTGAVVTIDPAKGKTVTRRPAVSGGGTATVRIEVRSRTKVVVVSGGVRSAAHLIRLR